jgi:hypothetical protein
MPTALANGRRPLRVRWLVRVVLALDRLVHRKRYRIPAGYWESVQLQAEVLEVFPNFIKYRLRLESGEESFGFPSHVGFLGHRLRDTEQLFSVGDRVTVEGRKQDLSRTWIIGCPVDFADFNEPEHGGSGDPDSG